MGVLDRGTISESKEVFAANLASNSSLDSQITQRAYHESLEEDPAKRGKCRNVWWNIAFDVPLFAIVILVIFLLELCVIPSHKGGFFCNDPALSHVFHGDTITATMVVSTVLGLPILIVIITEFILHTTDFSIKEKLKHATLNALRAYKGYMFGLLCNLIVVEAMKVIMGSPRPVFFDICEPDTGKTCNGSEYVNSFTCTSTKYSAWAQGDSYHSFPSGHTSMSVYCGFFIAWYLQRRAYGLPRKTVLLVPTVQVLALVYAAVCSLTRITDHRHHWWDVAVGTAVGLGTCYFAISVLLTNFRGPSSRISSEVPSKLLFSKDAIVLTA